MHGTRIVTQILNDPELKKEWIAELKEIVENVIARRQKLREAIEALEVPGDWSCITKQKGMFAFLPISRISMGCVPMDKIEDIAERIASVLKK